MSSLLESWLEKREGSKFRVQDDLTRPGEIIPGGIRNVHAIFDDGERARLPSGGPRVGSDGRIRFFDQSD